MKSILGIGNALADIFVDLDNDQLLRRFGLIFGVPCHIERNLCSSVLDTLYEMYGKSGNVKIHAGGSAANAIIRMSGLGMRAGFIGKVGKDSMGDVYEAQMKSYKVETLLFRGSLPTGTSIVLNVEDALKNCIVTYRGAAVELKPEDLKKEQFQGYDYFHTECFLMQNRALFARALSLAHDAGCIVSLDLSSPTIINLNKGFVRQALADHADIVFATEEEAFALTDASTPKKALELLSEHCETVVLKMGERGSMVKRGTEVYQIPAVQPACKQKDTVGAGDSYAAGFLYAHSLGRNLIQCGESGAAYATLHINAGH